MSAKYLLDKTPRYLLDKAIDNYTIAHVGVGGLFAIFGITGLGALGMAIFWEIFEQPMKRRLPSLFPISKVDTFGNSFFDIVACMAGWTIGHRMIKKKRSMFTFKLED